MKKLNLIVGIIPATKKIRSTINLIATLFLIMTVLSLVSCDKEAFCGGKGTLTVKNSSLHTVQEIFISNTSYGTIDPDETKEIELPAGTYKLKFKGISGGPGCNSESEFVLDACGDVGRQCSY